MKVVEKKKALKKIIDELPQENLDETFYFVEDLVGKNERRKDILLKLLEKEKLLFKRLAE